jgi:hypothetical protein
MKHPVKHIKQLLTVACLVFWVAGFFVFYMPAKANSGNSVADEIISLNVTDRPLGEVLEKLSIAANCQFRINEKWEDYRITASFDNEPLYRGLKLILRDINMAVIYGAGRTVKIIVYDKGISAGEWSGQSHANKEPQDFNQEYLISGDATAPQPEAEISERSNDMEGGEQQPEKAAESDAATNEADAESTEGHESETVDAPTEETDFTPGDTKNSESIENNEESNEN